MNVNALRLVASTLVLGASISGCGPTSYAGRVSSNADQTSMMKSASGSAELAKSALAAKKGELAVSHAERAVAAMPQDASYRMLLGESYLAAGRFTSAETAFGDVLTLDSNNEKAALKLALAKIATGHSSDAVSVLETHKNRLSAADFGLAMTLAGDPSNGISTLETAARAEDATPKVRQNLALSYALAGRWREARVVAGQDLPPAVVTKRIVEWAALSRPTTAWDQVAGVLGVQAVFDSGQPQALALNLDQGAPVAVAAADAPVVALEPMQDVAEASVDAPAPVAVASLPSAAAPEAPLIEAEVTPIKQVIVPAKASPVAAAGPRKSFEAGRFAVQLGAYKSIQGAEQAWNRISAKVPTVSRFEPASARVRVKSASFYRLSVTGYTNKEDAGRVCTSIKASGMDCFVRSIAGDQPLRYALLRARGGAQRAAHR